MASSGIVPLGLLRGVMLQRTVAAHPVTWRKYAAGGRIREISINHACFHAGAASEMRCGVRMTIAMNADR